MIVHDIRSPLTSISGWTELLLKEQALSPDSTQTLNIILKESGRIKAFTEDMLLLAKSEAGKLVPSLKPVDILVLSSAARTNNEFVAGLSHVSILEDHPAESRMVHLDPDLFSRLLDNLVSNAVKYSPIGGKVVIRVEYPEPPGQVLIKVVDNGPGVSQEMKQKLFEIFATGETAPYREKQIGLGLAFCKMVVEAHGGRIRVEDNVPRGAVFIVEV
jgi:two-component system, sensor histidine kinase and response regulator